jgi:hypothetical protein
MRYELTKIGTIEIFILSTEHWLLSQFLNRSITQLLTNLATILNSSASILYSIHIQFNQEFINQQ